jgi:hypothetical protein
MRTRFACLLLCVFSAAAAAGEVGPLPAYFQQSWDVVIAEPLTIFTLPRPERLRAVAGRLVEVPNIILSGVPNPPSRPILIPTAAAYASVATDTPVLPAMAAIPLPIRRPAGIERPLPEAEEGRATEMEVPATKVAMLGGLPGAGMAINALARMAPLPPIVNSNCSVAKPYKVSALGPDGRTALQPAATLDYDMVQALVRWEAALQAAAKKTLGEPIITLHVAASYDCRTMNHRVRARLSEHAHANAIDISEYETASGKRITVAKDFYAGGENGAFLKQVHANTCDIFQVVLGPGSDGLHENHFHMDLGHWKACR